MEDSMKKMIVLVGAWVVSMLAAGIFGAAQVPVPQPAPRLPGIGEQPTVLSGPDLGFRVEGHKGRTPVGRFVVRVDGQWVEIEEAAGIRRLSSR
jgi:hypothetical protein